MNILAGLETFLYVISSVLFFPVIASLVLLTFWIVIFFGGFLREYLERRQGQSFALRKYKKMIEQEMLLLTIPDNADITLENLLQKAELELIKSLDKIRFVIRVGPALGLMGTLIPMGISLSALAQGNMQEMAGKMVTAFTTVIVGLACSVCAYLMSLVKEKWVRNDMREMEYLTEMTLRNAKCKRQNRKLEADDEIFEKTSAI